MSIDKATVTKIASLARIRVEDADKDHIAEEINGILGWIEQLQEVNTDGVEPLANVADIDLKMREDVITDGNKQAEILANAPESTAGFFVVPKIVE